MWTDALLTLGMLKLTSLIFVGYYTEVLRGSVICIRGVASAWLRVNQVSAIECRARSYSSWPKFAALSG